MGHNHIVFIGLGSNIGNKELNIEKAIEHIEKQANILLKSSIYSSEPWGFDSSYSFLNSVIKIETQLTPQLLFEFLKEIELKMGRVKKNKNEYEDRIIDLDILFFDDEIISNETLSIPHIQLVNRKFVLEPLNEISSDFIHPLLNKTIGVLLQECTDMSVLKQIHFKM
jgi:2-amino-4-hydroxy-6-hydroxymethyldihydropteridine diphosphokinase